MATRKKLRVTLLVFTLAVAGPLTATDAWRPVVDAADHQPRVRSGSPPDAGPQARPFGDAADRRLPEQVSMLIVGTVLIGLGAVLKKAA